MVWIAALLTGFASRSSVRASIVVLAANPHFQKTNIFNEPPPKFQCKITILTILFIILPDAAPTATAAINTTGRKVANTIQGPAVVFQCPTWSGDGFRQPTAARCGRCIHAVVAKRHEGGVFGESTTTCHTKSSFFSQRIFIFLPKNLDFLLKNLHLYIKTRFHSWLGSSQSRCRPWSGRACQIHQSENVKQCKPV